jgi:hypothetical protein
MMTLRHRSLMTEASKPATVWIATEILLALLTLLTLLTL